jgi:uncharacterized protein YjbI with pentapeptide repeats
MIDAAQRGAWLDVLKQSAKAWNDWHKTHLANGTGSRLAKADFREADLKGANLSART